MTTTPDPTTNPADDAFWIELLDDMERVA